MSETGTARRRLRLGLTWRVIALTSLVLVGLAALVTAHGHGTLERQFQEAREAHQARQHREIRLALERSAEGLRELAALVASAPELARAVQAGDSEGAHRALDGQWPTLQLEAGVERIGVYAPDGTQVAARGGRPAVAPEGIERWLHQVRLDDRPLTALICQAGCRQFSVVPMLVAGETAGMVMLSRSLVDLTRQLHDVSGSDVALLLRGDTMVDQAGDIPRLPEWDAHLLALTRSEVTLPWLQALASEVSMEALVSAPRQIAIDGRELEINAVTLAEHEAPGGSGYLLLITDITRQLDVIQWHTRNLFFMGLAGWLVAEAILLLILWRPMLRLRRLAQVLPGLAEGGFQRARTAIPVGRPRLADEIDLLETTTLGLADQLEALEREVRRRREQVVSQLRALGRERDFVSSLLDTARVLIVSQDAEGRITLINDYAQAALGRREDELVGAHFDAVFPGLVPIGRNSGLPREEERPLHSPGRGERIVAWYHAPLAAEEGRPAGRISVGLDITERKAAEARLIWLAQRDPLTELYNRRYFQEALDRALAKGVHGAVLLMDLDQFRDVNELSGHHAGDELLRLVAGTLLDHLEHRGVIARLGGDEFALLLEETDADAAVSVAQYMVKLLEDLGLSIGERRHRVSASIGIVLFPEHGETPTDLMASADVAMYKAKETGVQRWHLLHALDHAKGELQERVYWVEQLHQALQGDAFELMVQPIVRLRDRSVRHYEVLVRMRDPSGELLLPGRFIPFAEHSGQIVQLDRWVLRAALKVLRRVQSQGIGLAVNLSGQSLHDDGLTTFLADELRASGADPEHLILEITETAAVTDFSTARGVLEGIRALGCQTALDDFGVGFSSFHYLGQLPVDYIKIDGSFIRSLPHNEDSRIIVRAIADIAAGFGKAAIAEFVDQEVLVPMLRDYGIAYGQGYHLGRPVPVEEAFGPA
ncbi:EAL domain-containing protein [Alkalilimnicola ehrlichii MLHE-1]|nr:EAL domain-containing protein [Alkalilimnicola ehrlichii]